MDFSDALLQEMKEMRGLCWINEKRPKIMMMSFSQLGSMRILVNSGKMVVMSCTIVTKTLSLDLLIGMSSGNEIKTGMEREKV